MEPVPDVVRHLIHYSCHLLVPFLIARLFWKEHWVQAGADHAGHDADRRGSSAGRPDF
ncbi:MAG: DUF6122 family protein [Planctomycetota bacterium]